MKLIFERFLVTTIDFNWFLRDSIKINSRKTIRWIFDGWNVTRPSNQSFVKVFLVIYLFCWSKSTKNRLFYGDQLFCFEYNPDDQSYSLVLIVSSQQRSETCFRAPIMLKTKYFNIIFLWHAWPISLFYDEQRMMMLFSFLIWEASSFKTIYLSKSTDMASTEPNPIAFDSFSPSSPNKSNKERKKLRITQICLLILVAIELVTVLRTVFLDWARFISRL